jgi:Asp-tRNA(Asn)/Glu-tRNA(Gln) amidotransferase A subunit family amidase
LRTLRVGYFEDDGHTPVTKETRAAVQRAVQVLRDDGFTVEPFRPEGLQEALRLWRVLFIDGVSLLLQQAYKGRETDMYSITREVGGTRSERS